MDFMMEFVNRSDRAIAEYIDHIKKSDIPGPVKHDLIDVLETVGRQCEQAREMGWL